MIKEPQLELENSQTLFSFQTIRTPQSIQEESLEDYFIKHPDIASSALYSTTSDEFQTKLNSFQPMSLSNLKSSNIEFYRLAESLLQARSYITKDEFTDRIGAITNLTPEIYMTIWDNFCYQVFKGHSQEERDLLSTFIYGFHCIKNGITFIDENMIAESSEVDIDAFKRFLSSTIVIPKEFISPENNPIVLKGSANSENSSNTGSGQNYVMKRQIESQMTSDYKIAKLESLLDGVKKTQRVYLRAEIHQRDLFTQGYEQLYQSSYNDYLAELPPPPANPSPETPPVVPPFVAPPMLDDFDYTTLKANILDSGLSDEQKSTLDSLGLQSSESFENMIESIEENLASAYKLKFDQIPANEQTLVIDGYPIESLSFSNLVNASVGLCLDYRMGNLYFEDGSVNFGNTSEFATELSYKIGNGAFTSGEILNNAYSFTLGGQPAPTGPITVILRFVTNLGNTYQVTMNISNQTCGIGDLTLLGSSSSNENPIFGIVRQGIMDYRKVEQYICCYVPGEVSHIENIMAREYKSRTTRRLRRSENTLTTNTESEREKLTDTSTTEKNEMQEEISKLMQESKDFQLNAGINFSGPKVSGFVNGSMAYHTSKEESNKLAKSIAKEMTMKATERILDKTREERIQKIVEEYSDENQHGVDNRQGDKHISGVFRWVDKIYKNVIHNYGKRLIYEFMIPEPASFHDLALNDRTAVIANIEKPWHPEKMGVAHPQQMDPNKASYCSGAYKTEIDPAPKEYITISKAYSGGEDKSGPSKFSFNDLVVPTGYELVKVLWTYDHRRYHIGNNNRYSGTNMLANLTIGCKQKQLTKGGIWDFGNDSLDKKGEFLYDWSEQVNDENLSVSLIGWDIASFTLNVTAVFRVSNAHYSGWQVKAYGQMLRGYNELMRLYEEKLAATQTQQIEARQTNSMYFREIENTVLKKNCMAYLIENEFLAQSFVSGTSLASHEVNQNKALEDYASKIKFLEQAFEWEIMGYQFYPFYWAAKSKWADLYKQETSDKLFTKFLQSGMARVFLTVRPGFEEAVNWYLATGEVWMGAQPPVVGDTLFLSIVDELRQPASVVEGEWESRVPSTLTVIQADSIALDTTGLPCMQTCSAHQGQGFDSDTTTLKNLVIKL